jgi:hypothetical protein
VFGREDGGREPAGRAAADHHDVFDGFTHHSFLFPVGRMSLPENAGFRTTF